MSSLGDISAVAPAAVVTMGIDHVGLTVTDVAKSAAFFSGCLGWQVVGRRNEYPAIFVSDGTSRITLWQVQDSQNYVPFDRRSNIGLHHLAIKVQGLTDLVGLHSMVRSWEGVVVEFDPQLSGAGPKVHSMFIEPGGCRVELSWDPRAAAP